MKSKLDSVQELIQLNLNFVKTLFCFKFMSALISKEYVFHNSFFTMAI